MPAAEEIGCAGGGVGGDEAGAGAGDFAPDVDLVADEHGASAGERFGDGDAEIFLMRGEDKGFGSEESAPLEVVAQHGEPDELRGLGSGCGG